jgi:CMP-N-acetylneuraminic acid synthetase
MDIISCCKFSTLQVNEIYQDQRVYQLVKYREQFNCTNDDQEVCHEQASHIYFGSSNIIN